jgi:hypothetical protein
MPPAVICVPLCTAQVLLGFVMQGVKGLAQWDQWDQKTVIPPSLRSMYNETAFIKGGRCRDHPAVASQYGTRLELVDGYSRTAEAVFDYRSYSCLNGWSMGNAVTSGRDLARFFRDVFAPPPPPGSRGPPRLLSSAAKQAMQSWTPLTNDWCSTCFYGLVCRLWLPQPSLHLPLPLPLSLPPSLSPSLSRGARGVAADLTASSLHARACSCHIAIQNRSMWLRCTGPLQGGPVRAHRTFRSQGRLHDRARWAELGLGRGPGRKPG